MREDFAANVALALKRIQAQPVLFPKVEREFRRCLVTRFPYGILFRERDDEIEIVAVMHLHREPGYWQDRL